MHLFWVIPIFQQHFINDPLRICCNLIQRVLLVAVLNHNELQIHTLCGFMVNVVNSGDKSSTGLG